MHLDLGRTRSRYEQWRRSPLFTWIVENAEDKGEGEGEEEEQWLAVETAEASYKLLSTIHMQREQWRMQKMEEKEKGKRKRKSSGWQWKRRRLVVRGRCYPLFIVHCSVYARLLAASIYNTVCNSTQKAAWSCFLLSCGLNANDNGSH